MSDTDRLHSGNRDKDGKKKKKDADEEGSNEGSADADDDDDGGDDEVVWMTDTSEEAAKARAQEQLTAAMASIVTQGNIEAEAAERRKREEKRLAEEEAARLVRCHILLASFVDQHPACVSGALMAMAAGHPAVHGAPSLLILRYVEALGQIAFASRIYEAGARLSCAAPSLQHRLGCSDSASVC